MRSRSATPTATVTRSPHWSTCGHEPAVVMTDPAGPAPSGPTARAGRRPDGRTARGERTRRKIVDALLELLAEGDTRAAPERIVARAGVSLRTLWTNFKDLEHLYAEANARLMRRQDEAHQPIPPEATLAERVSAY